MKIGIIVAMDKELRLLLPLIQHASTRTVDGFELRSGTVGSNDICVMKCGIGKVNAALGCRAMIQDFAPELIVNTGVAGGTGGVARVLDVVAATGVGYHDVWCGPGTVAGQAAGCPALFAGTERVLALDCLRGNPKVKFGVIASGDIFVDRLETVEHVLRLYPGAVGVDMESGAIAQTCHRFGVPFVCLRVISDTPGEVADNGAQYDTFWEAAPAETFGLIRDILTAL